MALTQATPMAALPSLALWGRFATPVPTLHTASPSATSFLPLKSHCASKSARGSGKGGDGAGGSSGVGRAGGGAASSSKSGRGKRSKGKGKEGAPAVVLRAGQHPMRPHLIPSFTWHVLRGLRRHGFEAYLVGGSIRDLLLDVPPKDYDVLSTATTTQIRKSFPRARIVGRRFPICHVMVGGEIVEVSSFKTKEQLPPRRKRTPRQQLRMPPTKLSWLDDDSGEGEEGDEEVEEGDDGEEEGEEEEEEEAEEEEGAEEGAEEGLLVPVRPPREMVERKEWTGKDSERWLNAARRDFTVNGCVLCAVRVSVSYSLSSLLIPLSLMHCPAHTPSPAHMHGGVGHIRLMLDPFSGTLYDYVGALHDIKTRVLRTIQPALPSFLDDPVRVLRAMRMAAKARLSLHEDIVAALESPRLLSSLAHVNKERVQQEVALLLSYGSSEQAVRLLWSHRLMPLLLPLHSARLLDRGFPTSPAAAATADDLLFAMLRQLDRLTAPNAPCRQLVWVTILSLYLAATATTTPPAALLAAALRMRRGGLEWDRAAADAAEVVRRLRAGEPVDSELLLGSGEEDGGKKGSRGKRRTKGKGKGREEEGARDGDGGEGEGVGDGEGEERGARERRAEERRLVKEAQQLLPRALRSVLQMTHPGELSRHAHAQLGISLPEPVLVTRASTCEAAQLLYRSMSGRQVKDPLSLEYLLSTTGLDTEGEGEDEAGVRRNKQAGGRHKEQQRRPDDWGPGQVSAEVLDEAEMLVSWVIINSVPSIV
ncbi:unnamed protein product [Closterium sp. Naga37s-1]|nr:unnamed protein product [Closterium sp. Naga37s-1]